MEPCQGPSLTGSPAPQATCGCATSASPASQHANAWESAWMTAAVPLLWFSLLLVAIRRRRARTATVTLGLGPSPEVVPAAAWPLLVLSEREKRFVRALRRAFPRRPTRRVVTASPACGTT